MLNTVVTLDTGEHQEFAIGPCRVSIKDHTIIYQKASLRLEPKVIQVLYLLSQNENQIVSRQQLIETVWQGRAVTDDAVTRCISILRKSFSQSLNAPLSIETVAKSGYRLIVEKPSPEKNIWSQLKNTYLISGVGLALFAGVIGMIIWQSRPQVSPGYQREAFAVSEHKERYPNYSRDGKMMTYSVSTPPNGMAVVIRQPATNGYLQLTSGKYYDHQPVFSPDQNYVAFARINQHRQCEIRRIPVIGGQDNLVGRCGNWGVADLEWSLDGKQLIFVDKTEPLKPGRLTQLNLDNGSKIELFANHFDIATGEITISSQVPDKQTDLGIDDLAISRDGKTMAIAVSFALGVEDIFIGPISGEGPWKRVTRDNTKVHGISWANDNQTLFYTSNRLGPFQLWQIDVDNHKPTLISDAWLGGDALSVQVDGAIAIERWTENSAVYNQSLNTDEQQILISDKGVNWDLQPAPDGSARAFVSDRSGSAEIWFEKHNQLTQMTQFNGPWVMTPRWSPNSKYLSFMAPIDGKFSLYLIDVEKNTVKQVQTDKSVFSPQWSSDSQSIIFGYRFDKSIATNKQNQKDTQTDKSQSGRWQIARYDMKTGQLSQLTHHGAKTAQFSDNDQVLYFTKSGEAGLWRIRISTPNIEEKVLSDLAPVDWNNWRLTSEYIYWVKRNPGQAPLLTKTSIHTGKHQTLTELNNFIYFSGFWIDEQAQSIWYAGETRADADIDVLIPSS
ncbi:winged helix-turn-helix domain-containing protein [Aliikangiella coralliicola]|uniref:OmpR/PhoB-type domain-containing protein n=1 Tax=Aliikangiella coralliicola TaxID=2592383 RepID=A0A545UJ19_9GAMM|nr:winged helix-turn-helix domain-containing protein [Aliikangiella coralliicola]TQV89462.1 hypothetical protein FLL46_00855 [Aliikangiella coralliicola]